ncbi:His Kinase A (phospho-acceptor) domain-containing protein [Sporobacter termitidis DSM 10068]|uniref:histidine kinase n=1 Tax=Sporobacter termitidis DSM 10068 TaxID=1123282 RepID=A0A1M5YT71_9FIRM|nr:HAMP domain-containing sensor histidine kinase [Sporobacter termitidis]SHI15231.1 His Kinase A (phospho-acceptor) domain-containing protein [Sporobacter termitidis DSM 10068]
MIKKLRRKFILVIMSVVAVLMLAAFIGVWISTYGNLEQENRFALSSALDRSGGPTLRGGRPGIRPGDRPVPIITVTSDSAGGVTDFSNQIFNFSDGDVPSITRLALERGKASGILRDYNLRYMLEKSPDGSARLVFIDNAMESRVLANLLKNSAVVGASTLLLFFAVSVLLARWVVKPVEKAWNSQRRFIADASHELKTPLTVILSNSAMLAEEGGQGGGKAAYRLGNILAEAKRMKSLVDELLSLARSDEAGAGPRFERVDFSAVLLGAALMFEPVIFDMGKAFDYEIANGLFVTGDASRLHQLAGILLDNAGKYSTPASRVTLSARPGAKNEVCLEITNESETIPKAELDKIFERFYRLDKARSGGGYGLGLSIATSIVREHGGKIRAASENGRTVFTVLLPGARL